MLEPVRFLPELGAIQVAAWGQLTTEDMAESRQAVAQVGQEWHCAKVLVDMRQVQVSASGVDVFNHLYDVTREPRLREKCYGIVVSAVNHPTFHLLEIMGSNRGTKVKVFWSREEALDWLKDG